MSDVLSDRPCLLVTGGSGSVGMAVCTEALEMGYRIVLHGRSTQTAEAARDRLASQFDASRIVVAWGDLTVFGEAEKVCAEAADAWGRLDGIANCMVQAPTGITGPLRDTDPQAYTTLLHDSVTQVQWLLHAGAKAMSSGGSFVTMISDAGLFAAPHQALIAASRAGVAAFCRNAALELARDAIRVNCVSSSYIADSGIADALRKAGSTRIERAGHRAGLGLPTCQDIAKLFLFLLGPGSSRLTGQVVSVNGGLNA